VQEVQVACAALAVETFEVAEYSFDGRSPGPDKVNEIVTNLNVLALNARLKNLKASNEAVNVDRAISSGEASSSGTRDYPAVLKQLRGKVGTDWDDNVNADL